MVIKIPSKNIYEINNNKILDNKIDKIEISANRGTLVYSYNETTSSKALSITNDESGKTSSAEQYATTTTSTVSKVYASATFTEYNYTNLGVIIPKLQNGKKTIERKDIEIKTTTARKLYQAKGNICQATATNSGYTGAMFYLDSGTTNAKNLTYTDLKNEETTNGLSFSDRVTIYANSALTTEGDLFLDTTPLLEAQSDGKFSSRLYVYSDTTKSPTASETVSLSLNNKDSVSVTEDDTNIYISGLRILTKIVTYYCATAHSCLVANIGKSSNLYLDSKVVKSVQSVKTINLSVLGDSVTLNWETQNGYVGDKDGKHPLSFTDNKLLQFGNTRSENLIGIADFEQVFSSQYYIDTPTGFSLSKDTTYTLLFYYTNAESDYPLSCSVGYGSSSFSTEMGSISYNNGSGWVKLTFSTPSAFGSYSGKLFIRFAKMETLGNARISLQHISLSKGEDVSSSLYYNFSKTIEQYKNGKETATLLCDINDYYNDDGSIAITKSGIVKLFKIGDIVLPMVFGANGQDRPMSTYKDGAPKYFKVVGTRVFFDGAVWQELTLQEYIA